MTAFQMGVRTGIMIGLIVLLIGIIVRRKNNNDEKHYDERQLAIRGIGYKYGFWTLVVEIMVYGANIPEDGTYKIAPVVMMFAMVLIAGLVMMTYDVMHDAYFTLTQKKKQLMWCWIAIAAGNFAVGITNIAKDEMWAKGIISERVGLPFILFGFFTLFFVILGIKTVIDKKETEE